MSIGIPRPAVSVSCEIPPGRILSVDPEALYHGAAKHAGLVMTQPPIVRSLSRANLAILAAVLFLAGFLRFYHIAGPSLWMDELWSVEMAMGHGSLHDHLPPNVIHHDQPLPTGIDNAAPWWSICAHLSGVTHPPLYFIVLRWWIDLFGNSAAAIRSLSAVFSLAGIVVFFDLCRFLHGSKNALFAAAISALAIAQIDFAKEARGYPMLICLGLCCADQVVRIEFLGPGRRRLIALAIFLFATALTHYLSAGALIGLAIYAALRLRGSARMRTMAAFAAAAVLILAVWIPLFIEQKHTLPSLAPTFLREARTGEHARLTFYRIIGLPVEFLLGESRGEALTSKFVLAVFVFIVAAAAIRLVYDRAFLLWILWGLGTVGFVAAMDLAHQTTLVGYLRYTILASSAVYAVIAAFNWPPRRFIRDALAISSIGLLTIVGIQRCIDGTPAKEDWQTLAHDLDASAGPDDLVVFYNDDPWISSGTWYMGFKYYTPESRRPWLILDRSASPDLLRQLRSLRRLWLVGRFPALQGPRLLQGWLPTGAEEQTSAGAFCPMVPADRSSPTAARP
jgi:hypothetical protein